MNARIHRIRIEIQINSGVRRLTKTQPNWYRYLVSLADELRLQSNRVRDLIGDSHWLSDGHHKEYLLLSLLNRHLPAGMMASRGFVISPKDSSLRSKEQDIVILDTLEESPVFDQGGLVIAFPRQVRAAISVKSTMKSSTINNSVEGLHSVWRLVTTEEEAQKIWCGAYFFQASDNITSNPGLALENLSDAVGLHWSEGETNGVGFREFGGLNVFATSDNLVMQRQFREAIGEAESGSNTLIGYEAEGHATAVLLADLLDHLAHTRGAHDLDFALFAEHATLSPIGEPIVL